MIDQIARQLAEALMDFGYTRKPEDHQRVLALQTQLCRLVRDEKKAAEAKQETT